MSVSAMKKLTVLAYRSDADALVRKLMDLKCVEIRTSVDGALPDAFDTFGCNAQKTEAERRLAAIRRALPTLSAYTTRKGGLGRIVHRVNRAEFCRDGRRDAAWRTVEDTLQTLSSMEALDAEQTRNENLIASMEPWLGYDVAMNEVGTATTKMLLGVYPPKTDPAAVTAELEALGAYLETVGGDEQGIYITVTCHKNDFDAVERAAVAQGFAKLSFPDVPSTARVAAERAQERLAEIDMERMRCEEKLRDLAEKLADVEILSDVEETTVRVCEQKRKLAATENCAVLSGWIPEAAEKRLAETLSEFECAVDVAEPEEGEEPPILLRNNSFASNFEWVVGMYSYPKYGAFDPTWIMSIFYFVIFGLMFADVGYGLMLVACCFGGIKLLNPKPGLRRMMMMFGYCGFSCIIMGVVFGGWFGDLPVAIMTNLLHLPVDTGVGHFFASGLWFNPLDDPMTFLILSLGVGAVHMIAGMAVDFVVKCKRGQAAEAASTIIPYWILFAGLALFLVNSTAGAIGSAAGALAILLFNGYGQRNIFKRLFKGLGGLYGLISYASDLLSYSRILALGLVAGVIAKVINLITMMGDGNPIGFVIMLIVLILGHVLNIAINLLGTFIHASRLQYLEFFGKFFEDGGEAFTPACPAEEYSEEPQQLS